MSKLRPFTAGIICIFLTALAITVIWTLHGELRMLLAPFTDPSWRKLKASERVNAISQLRIAIVQVLAATGAAIALIYTARNYQLSRRGQVTDRFTKALERLGAEEMFLRIGGLLALEQIVQDSPDQANDASEVLQAFLKWQAGERIERITRKQNLKTFFRRYSSSITPLHPWSPSVRDDVQVALTSITRPKSRVHANRHLSLTNLNLCGARLTGADLRSINFTDTDLSGSYVYDSDLTGAQLLESRAVGIQFLESTLDGASFTLGDFTYANFNDCSMLLTEWEGATLAGADFQRCKLKGSSFKEANLSAAKFFEADLTGVDFREANLDYADLRGANLVDTLGLYPESLSLSIISRETRFSPEIADDPVVKARMEEIEKERESEGFSLYFPRVHMTREPRRTWIMRILPRKS